MVPVSSPGGLSTAFPVALEEVDQPREAVFALQHADLFVDDFDLLGDELADVGRLPPVVHLHLAVPRHRLPEQLLLVRLEHRVDLPEQLLLVLDQLVVDALLSHAIIFGVSI